MGTQGPLCLSALAPPQLRLISFAELSALHSAGKCDFF